MAQELSEEKILGSKFTLSLQTIIAGGMGLSSLIGMWYMLQADIQEAKELPVPLSLFSQEYPSKGISDFNWSPSYEQYKQQVGNLQENQDDLYDGYRMRYKHPPRYPYGYDYYYRPLEYRSVIRTQSNTRNDEKRSGGTTGTTTFNHTPQQRTESWGTKN